MNQAHHLTATNGAGSCNTNLQYGVDELMKEIDLCNNGYLRVSTLRMVMVAQLHPELFTYSGGLIYKKGLRIEHGPAVPKAIRTLEADGPDYEALILDRQAADGLYD